MKDLSFFRRVVNLSHNNKNMTNKQVTELTNYTGVLLKSIWSNSKTDLKDKYYKTVDLIRQLDEQMSNAEILTKEDKANPKQVSIYDFIKEEK